MQVNVLHVVSCCRCQIGVRRFVSGLCGMGARERDEAVTAGLGFFVGTRG
jgi:hypothetical protein